MEWQTISDDVIQKIQEDYAQERAEILDKFGTDLTEREWLLLACFMDYIYDTKDWESMIDCLHPTVSVPTYKEISILLTKVWNKYEQAD